MQGIKVDYIDHMGTDLTVVNAARVSFNKTSELDYSHLEPGKEHSVENGKLSEKDQKLIVYLAKHNHWSPFAHTSIQLRVRAPIFIARQMVKHQIGGVWNEVSRRYVDDTPEFFDMTWRKRPDGSMKQGSAGPLEPDLAVQCDDMYDHVIRTSKAAYEFLLERGVAPEQARAVLPLASMTEWYWTGSLVFFARVCKLREDSHAQAEAGELAREINRICGRIFPVSWKALMST